MRQGSNPDYVQFLAWITYGWCSLLWLLAFTTIYLSCNALAEQRTELWSLHLDVEKSIPFLPSFIWAYLSLFLLWPFQALMLSPSAIRGLTLRLLPASVIAGLCFLLFPAQLGFQRQLPEDPFLASIFQWLFHLDRPHNLVPSLHVANAALVILSLQSATPKRWMRLLWSFWLILIALSTLVVHQHHLLDVFTGLLLGIALHRYGPQWADFRKA